MSPGNYSSIMEVDRIVLQAPFLVEVPHAGFLNILNEVTPIHGIDTGTLLVTAGTHPQLGEVMLIDNPLGGRVVAVDQSKLTEVQHYTKQ